MLSSMILIYFIRVQTSKIESYARMWKAMEEFSPNVFVDSTADGIDKVTQGQYAFLLDRSYR